MEDRKYEAIVEYLRNGNFPSNFDSTKGNFKANAENYTLNGRGNLIRDEKIVVKMSDIPTIWAQYHGSYLSCVFGKQKLENLFFM